MRESVPGIKVLNELMDVRFDPSIIEDDAITSTVSPWLNINRDGKAYKYLKKNRIYGIGLLSHNNGISVYVIRGFNAEPYVYVIRDGEKKLSKLDHLTAAFCQYLSGVKAVTYKQYIGQ